MNTKNLTGECQQCGGHFEFPAEAAGATGECPHCGQATECVLAAPPEEKSPLRAKAIVFTVIALMILAGGWMAAQLAVQRAERMVGRKPGTAAASPAQNSAPETNAFAGQNFRVSAVTLEPTPGTKLVHATGAVVNLAPRQRFGVKVELDLLDAAGKTVATASDYISIIEPGAEWDFRAPVTDGRAVRTRVTSVKETK